MSSDEEPRYINTQVQSAVKTNNLKALKACILMAKEITHFDLNGEDEDGMTGLVEACIAGNTDMVQMLLDAGCPAQPSPVSVNCRYCARSQYDTSFVSNATHLLY